MKLQVLLLVAVVATAGSAAAQDYGTFAPNAKKPQTVRPEHFAPLPSSSYAPSTASSSRYATPPAGQGFKPYQPFKGSSVYSQPRGYGAPSGAKPCETSVYVNACDRR